MDFDINPRILAFMSVFGVILLLLFGTPFLFPHSQQTIKINNTTPNVLIVYKTIEKLVTPTPDGHIYFASEYQNGTRLLQHPFSWIRNNALIAQNANTSAPIYDNNGIFIASENPENKPDTQDMKVTTIVYDYKMFDKLHAFNPADYKYEEIYPDNPENKFLLVFVYVFMDDIIGDDTRMYMFKNDAFVVYEQNSHSPDKKTYYSKEFPFQLRFKELEETFTFNNDYRVEAFKSFRQYGSYLSNPEYVSTAGEYNDQQYYLRGGKSNALDGYLIYEIPKDDNPEDLIVLGSFYSFGWSNWLLRA
jgi:hypothetical protein